MTEEARVFKRTRYVLAVCGVLGFGLLGVALPATSQMMRDAGPGMMNAGRSSSSPTTGIPLGASKGEKEFHQVCSTCHETPDPRMYAPDQWPRVVGRMKYYMSSYGMTVPDPKTFRDIEQYLKSHAAN